MHFQGLGTFSSCEIASTLLKHVADVGEHTLDLKNAYSLVEAGDVEKATMLYMNLAEQGMASAQLNVGILLDKYDIFNSEDLMVYHVINRTLNDSSFNINKHLAYKYFTQASEQKDTENEANLKLGDYFYYGIACD
mmetsp:Transcript_4760/g.4417  ORF Transcript_4760/g.4417 Transcript_4760/m.4417 type:complete len:136 (-) Transcript_4760:400-807(-)